LKRQFIYIIVLLSVLLLVWSFIQSWRYSTEDGGVDLRCRIVGARLSATGQSPYFTKTTTPGNDFLLDPADNPSRKVNGNVVTPALLTIVYPLAKLSYPTIRIIWTLLQYLFVLLAFIMLQKRQRQFSQHIIVPLFVFALVICSSNWFYNIERGQVYSFYLFLLCLAFWLYTLPWKYSHVVSGFITGLFVWTRFLMAGLFVPFLLKRDIKWCGGFIIGLIAGACVFVLPKTGEWTDYFSAMKIYSNEMLGSDTYDKNATLDNVPAQVEGTGNLQRSVYFRTGGLSTIQYYLHARGVSVNAVTLVCCFSICALLLSLCFIKMGPGPMSTEQIFLFGFLLYISAELFLVGFRGGYNLIQWLFPVLLIGRQWPVHRYKLLLFAGAFLLTNDWLLFVPHQTELAEIVMFIVLISASFTKPTTEKSSLELYASG
jgi:hypothetical protein